MPDKTLGADVRTKIAEAHGEAVASATEANVASGATEKQAYAVAMRDHGKTNEEVGLGMEPVWGSATKPGGAGNVVTAGLRALGREAEIASAGAPTKQVLVRDGLSLMRDELDRMKAALDNVTKPVTEAEAAITAMDADPASVVTARTEAIAEAIKTLRAEAKTLDTEEGAKAYTEATRTALVTKRDAAKTASDENAATLRAGVAEMTDELEVLEAMLAAKAEARAKAEAEAEAAKA